VTYIANPKVKQLKWGNIHDITEMSSLVTFFKLVRKAFSFAIIRSAQRFNVANRAKKYLGPDAEYFEPAPRAIGSLSLEPPKKYPHLEKGFRSVRERRLLALRKDAPTLDESKPAEISAPTSLSITESDDSLVREVSSKLLVTKTVQIEERSNKAEAVDVSSDKEIASSRTLPKLTSLDLSDPADIWEVDKVPPGRLSLNMLQDIMLNKLADEEYWTPKAIAEKHSIKEEYAESLLKYLKHIKIIVSPGLMKNMEYVGRNNPTFQAAKHIVYFVDVNLRTEADKEFDGTFLPSDELEPDVRKVLNFPSQLVNVSGNVDIERRIKRPAPLRIKPLNQAPQPSELNRQLNSPQKRLNPPKVSDDKVT